MRAQATQILRHTSGQSWTMGRTWHSLSRALLLALVGLGLSGCGILGKRVSAFEKANLAKPGMALVAAPKEQAHMNHMFNAREGSVGGFGGAGGGCGCN
jgi:hypothetical protein